MAALSKLVLNMSWWIGLISLIAGFLIKLIKPSGIRAFGSITAHNLLYFAIVLFLCALATSAIEISNRT